MDAVEKRPGEGGLPQPTQKLGKEAAVVTMPDGDPGDPTDLDFDGEDYDPDRDGPIPDYPQQRVAAEIEQAVTTKDEEG